MGSELRILGHISNNVKENPEQYKKSFDIKESGNKSKEYLVESAKYLGVRNFD